MATLNQIRANRENAKKSTGPRTDAGKARSAMNGLAHGLYATKLHLSLEDEERTEAVRTALLTQYAPATPIELILVDDLIRTTLRLQRLNIVEVEAQDFESRRVLHQADANLTPADIRAAGPTEANFWLGMTTHADLTRGGADFQTKLARQRAAAERSFYRALRTLQDEQRRRLADTVVEEEAAIAEVQTEPNSPQVQECPPEPTTTASTTTAKQQTEPKHPQTGERPQPLSPTANPNTAPNAQA